MEGTKFVKHVFADAIKQKLKEQNMTTVLKKQGKRPTPFKNTTQNRQTNTTLPLTNTEKHQNVVNKILKKKKAL